MSPLRHAIAALGLGLLLAACGGGDGGGDAPPEPPTANAGATQSAMTGETITLDGRGSTDPQGRSLSYRWRLASRPAGSAAVLAGTASAQASFVPDLVGSYVAVLAVDNGSFTSAESSVTLNATPDIRGPARLAALAATVDFSLRTVRLAWSDTLPSGTRYQVESVDAGGTGTVLATLDGSGGAGAAMSWQGTLAASVTLRVRAAYQGSLAPLQTAQGAASLPIAVPAVAPSIQLGTAEPLGGTVMLSIGDAGTVQSVAWYADLAPLATTTIGPAFAYPWDTLRVVDGPHLLLARMALAPGVTQELRRTVEVANTSIRITAGLSGFMAGQTWLIARATSDFGIVFGEAFVDGRSLGGYATYNLCTPWCSAGEPDAFGWQLDTVGLGSGEHEYQIRITDGSGAVRTSGGLFSISNPPIVTLDAPLDGAMVSGTLVVSGRTDTDKPQPMPITVTVTLGGLEILRTTASPFATSFSLAGVVPGAYTLTVRAVDRQGTATVVTRVVTVAP